MEQNYAKIFTNIVVLWRVVPHIVLHTHQHTVYTNTYEFSWPFTYLRINNINCDIEY